MKSFTQVLILSASLLCSSLGVAQEMDKELPDLSTKLTGLIKENGKRKVTVLDFTDLQGVDSELGKYIAEELTVNLVIQKKDFSVLDRANLRKILAEHKLTATGLVDPENAKKLGQFAGVDALVLGTIVPKGQKVAITAKIITTDTAEIVGAAKSEFKSDETVQQLLNQPATDSVSGIGSGSPKEGPVITKSFGDLQVILQSLQIVNGHDYLLTLSITNTSNKITAYAAVHCEGIGIRSGVRDPEGYEFEAELNDAEGVPVGYVLQYLGYQGRLATLKPRDAVTGTIKYHTRERQRPASPGLCKIRLEIVRLSINGEGRVVGETSYNMLTDMRTN